MTASAPTQASSSTCVLWMCTPALPAGLGGGQPLPALGSALQACVHLCALAVLLHSCVPACLQLLVPAGAPHCKPVQTGQA